jgi:hypothetical protein
MVSGKLLTLFFQRLFLHSLPSFSPSLQSLPTNPSYGAFPDLSLSNAGEYDDATSSVDGFSGSFSRKSIDNKFLKNGRFSDDGFTTGINRGGRQSLSTSLLGGVGRKRKQKEKMLMYTVNAEGIVEIVNIAPSSGDQRGAGLYHQRRTSFPHSTHHGNIHDDYDVNLPFSGYTAPSILETITSISNLETIPVTIPSSSASSSSSAISSSSSSSSAAASSVASSVKEIRLIHDQVEGPRYVCNPHWPNFVQSLSYRNDMSTITGNDYRNSSSSYYQDLEFKLDEYGEKLLPVKYRSRYRVGRSGRLIMDRVPVSHFLYCYFCSWHDLFLFFLLRLLGL